MEIFGDFAGCVLVKGQDEAFEPAMFLMVRAYAIRRIRDVCHHIAHKVRIEIFEMTFVNIRVKNLISSRRIHWHVFESCEICMFFDPLNHISLKVKQHTKSGGR